MMSDRKHLVLLGCSASKRDSGSQLPAISLYDGPAFRVLRAYLRDYRWPKQLSVAVLSARYGVIGGLSRISTYDQRMTRTRAAELAPKVNQVLSRWQMGHSQMDLILGQDYLHAIDQSQFGEGTVRVVDGPIGVKLNRLHSLLRSLGGEPRKMTGEPGNSERPLYFLPD